jgi:hypothetical protein
MLPFIFLLLLSTIAVAISNPPIPNRPRTPLSNAEKIAANNAAIPNFNVKIVEPTSTNTRGNVPDTTDLEKDVIPDDKVLSVGTTFNDSDIEDTDDLLFNFTMEVFLKAKSEKVPSKLDWSDDGCSAAPDFPAGFNFLGMLTGPLPPRTSHR